MNETATNVPTPPAGSAPQAEAAARLFTLLRRGAWPALFAGLLIAAAVFATRAMAPAVYTATVALLLASPQQGLDSLGIVTPPPVDASAYRTLVLEGPVLEQVLISRGEAVDSAALTSQRDRVRVSIESQQISSVLRLQVTDADPVRAADVANLLASAVVDWDRERGRQGLASGIASLERSVLQLQSQADAQLAARQDATTTLALLTRQQDELAAARSRLAAIVVTPLIDVMRFAEAPGQPDDRRPLPFAVIAFIVAVLAVYGLMFVRMLLNQRLRSAAEATSVTRLPVLSIFPGAGHRNPERAERDAADILRAGLLEGAAEDASLVILVTTAESASGRRSVSTALAESFGRAGHTTLLVDANLRNPGSAQAFNLQDGEFPSLEQYLIQPDRQLELIEAHRDGVRMFSLMPSFRPAEWSADLLRNSLPELLDNWRSRFSVIILETAPLLPYPDTLSIVSLADRALLVAGMGRSDPDRLQAAADALRKFRAHSPGMVLVEAASWPYQLGLRRDPAHLSERYSISVPRSTRRDSKDSAG